MSKKLTLGVFGSEGRMGIEICKQIDLAPDLLKSVDFKAVKPDVVIDFTSPEGTSEIATWCAENKVPLVTGTTGLTEEQQECVNQSSKKIPILQSPNMSLGINSLAVAIQAFMKNSSGWDIAVEDIHHKHKKDSPSGTAKFFHEIVSSEAKGKSKVLDTVSIRGGEVFGIHKIYFFSESEWVAFEHHATDRSVFARGAVAGGRWIIEQEPGLYSMFHFLRGSST